MNRPNPADPPCQLEPTAIRSAGNKPSAGVKASDSARFIGIFAGANISETVLLKRCQRNISFPVTVLTFGTAVFQVYQWTRPVFRRVESRAKRKARDDTSTRIT